MKKIWYLTRIQLGIILDFNIISRNRKDKKRNNSLVIFAVTALFLLLSGSSFIYSYAIGSTLQLIGMLELLPELMMALTCAVTIITTVYKVKGTLFGFKDYDVTMSLPVKTSEIVVSRLCLLYLLNIIFTIIIIVPADIAYGILSKSPSIFYVISFLLLFFIPFVPMVAGALIGTVISVIAARFRHSNIINIIIIFTFLTLLMILPISVGDSEEKLGMASALLTKKVNKLYFLADMYRSAVIDYKIESILAFLVLSLLVVLFFALIVGRKFKAINTRMLTSFTKSNYKIGSLVQASPFKALFNKELKRYFSSTLYVMNTAFGIVMMTIGAIATLFMNKEKLAVLLEIPGAAKNIEIMAPVIVSFCVVMTCTSASSISLEGKNLWILKSIPVGANTIFLSKIAVNLLMTLPAVIIDGIIIIAGLKLSWDKAFMLLVMPAAYSVFTSVYGLVINLHLPNLNWTTEVTVIKQSAATMVAIFSGIIFAAVPIILLGILKTVNALLINGLITAFIIILTIALYYYLNKKGSKIFTAL